MMSRTVGGRLMSPAGLLFRNAVWHRLTESKPWEPRELRAGRGGRHRGPAKEDQERIGAQRASGVPQEKEEPDSEGCSQEQARGQL
uniref:Uncharacterized protein n=1 Tax=Rangifer tarandus platyrhynchus TaxID=3082113 RepID=A0ACB0FG58_RANTA|nr:unnamed protein product [Rangifer tarandus platyrhynchus]